MTVILPFAAPGSGIAASGGQSPDPESVIGPGGDRSAASSVAQWVMSFACHRRQAQDAYWLKENAELLSLLNITRRGTPGLGGTAGTRAEAALVPLRPFYEDAARTLRFFPQYYRFILSICLDYEDLLGHSVPAASTGSAAGLAHWVAQQGLVEAELSDLQRAEARQLLARRGIVLPVNPGLDDRLRQFTRRSQTFAIPNRKAAYELTHIVFYLSDYGRRDPGVDAATQRSLIYAGLVAGLDQDVDLLSEICIALRYCGATPPPLWEQALTRAIGQFVLTPDGFSGGMDGYHAYFVCLWWQMAQRGASLPDGLLPAATAGQGLHICAPNAQGLLRPLSTCVMGLGNNAHVSPQKLWQGAVDHITEQCGQAARRELLRLGSSTPEFAEFWQVFSRPGHATTRTRGIGADGLSLTGHPRRG
ncbi:DUF6902 family protein [Phaeobacter porticola]|uniref:Uncharacterized protein n=1 Tax=Phaeobacter porticola TaxID=1844006 RepID=A0A1L3I350_9RHOB|nr:hypothetical protein [Phaeobacter porticola]APG46531.1 hypothetical protein PhaeoP97_01104 [Phaeobacter porticola]